MKLALRGGDLKPSASQSDHTQPYENKQNLRAGNAQKQNVVSLKLCWTVKRHAKQIKILKNTLMHSTLITQTYVTT